MTEIWNKNTRIQESNHEDNVKAKVPELVTITSSTVTSNSSYNYHLQVPIMMFQYSHACFKIINTRTLLQITTKQTFRYFTHFLGSGYVYAKTALCTRHWLSVAYQATQHCCEPICDRLCLFS